MTEKDHLAREIESYFDRLWPIMRSITGEGVRKSHDILAELIPLERMEIPTGTQVFDWTVPKEWVVREAYIVSPSGDRIMDIRDNNLHLMNYSIPFQGRLSRNELDTHLHSLPNQPEAIPYITSYYEPRWGFCLSQHQRDTLPNGEYQVYVDTELIDGSMTMSHAILPGQESDEVLISTYTCHPSLANNELSGPLVAAFLYRYLASLPERRLTYRFVFAPETIGAIAYLSKFGEELMSNVVAGYIVTCIGDPGSFTYKRSRRGSSLADRAAEHVLKRDYSDNHSVVDFFPLGSDERQYCSPGFNLPIGSIMRTMYGAYSGYHTSEDNREFISFDAMAESVHLYGQVCTTLDVNKTYRNLVPYCEPNLGKRDLYSTLGAVIGKGDYVGAILWLLNLSDGDHDLITIAERSGVDISQLSDRAADCLKHELLTEAKGSERKNSARIRS